MLLESLHFALPNKGLLNPFNNLRLLRHLIIRIPTMKTLSLHGDSDISIDAV